MRSGRRSQIGFILAAIFLFELAAFFAGYLQVQFVTGDVRILVIACVFAMIAILLL